MGACQTKSIKEQYQIVYEATCQPTLRKDNLILSHPESGYEKYSNTLTIFDYQDKVDDIIYLKDSAISDFKEHLRLTYSLAKDKDLLMFNKINITILEIRKVPIIFK